MPPFSGSFSGSVHTHFYYVCRKGTGPKAAEASGRHPCPRTTSSRYCARKISCPPLLRSALSPSQTLDVVRSLLRYYASLRITCNGKALSKQRKESRPCSAIFSMLHIAWYWDATSNSLQLRPGPRSYNNSEQQSKRYKANTITASTFLFNEKWANLRIVP